MDIRRLIYFSRIGKSGSISKAAELLGISQPALSRQMRLLEESLGTPLFERHPRGVELTNKGKRLHQRIDEPLLEIEASLREVSGKQDRTVSIGLLQTVADLLASPLTRRLNAEFPGMTFQILEGSMNNLVSWLVSGKVILAIILSPETPYATQEYKTILSEFVLSDLLIDDLVLIGPASGDAPSGDFPDDRDLDNIPMIIQNGNSDYFSPSPYHEDFLSAKSPERRFFTADSLNMTKAFVESGLAYAILPYSSVINEVRTGRLRIYHLKSRLNQRRLIMAKDPKNKCDILKRVQLMLVDEVQNLIIRGVWKAEISNNTWCVDAISLKSC